MASYMRLHFALKTASLSSSIFNISQQRVRSCFPLRLSLLPCRNVCSASNVAPELPPSLSPQQVTDRKGNRNQRLVNIPLYSIADNQVVKLPIRILPELIYPFRLWPEERYANCTGSWLAYVNGRKCGFYLAFTCPPSLSSEIIQLPSIETLPPIKGVVRDSSPNVVKEYNYHKCHENPDGLSWLHITRIAMSSGPNIVDNNCTIMISNGDFHHLAFCRIGDTSWTPLENQLDEGYEEIIYSKKDQLFYALTHEGHVEAWDLRDPTSPKAILIEVGNESLNLSKSERDLRNLCYNQPYFVELAGGDILYVERYFGFVGEDGSYVDTNDINCTHFQRPYRTTRFDAFNFELEKKNAKYVTSIGDNALFLGINHSFSLSTRDYPHLKSNSIYFTDKSEELVVSELIFDKKWKGKGYGGPYDGGVYNIEDHSVTPIYHPFEFEELPPPPIWVFPGKN